MFRFVVLLAATLAAGMPLALVAEADTLGTVVITATRTLQPMGDTLASVDVITRDDLALLPAADIADALQMHTGIEIARVGGPGQQTSLFLRGTDSNHVLVLVDGVRINPGTIGAAALQNITPDMVERIEVVKGPRSTLYGSDAIGGVINIITRKGAAAGTHVQVGAGSFGTHSAGLSAGGSAGVTDASLSAYWLDSAGFPTRTGDTTNRGYRNLSLNGSLRTEAAGWQLSATGWRAAGTSQYSDFYVTPVDQDFVTSALSVQAATRPAADWHTRIVLGHATDEISQNQSPDFLRTHRWQLDWQNDVTAGRWHELTAGLLLQREDATSASYGTGFDSRTQTRLYYLQDQAHYGRQRLLLAAGYTDSDTFGGHVTWNAEYGRHLGEMTFAWLAAGTAFRAPDATDRFGYGGNPALRPEASRSWEAGLRSEIGESQQLSVTAFRTDIHDLIQYVITDYTTYDGENRNVDRARITGVEASWQVSRGGWDARLGVTLQDPRDLSTDSLLLRRARQNVTLALARHIGPHEVSLDVLVAGERHDFGSPAPVRLAPYTLANLSARIVLADDWVLVTRLENLLDEHYALAAGYNTPARSLFVSLRRSFR